jgi:hypothetical protein
MTFSQYRLATRFEQAAERNAARPFRGRVVPQGVRDVQTGLPGYGATICVRKCVNQDEKL